MTTKDRYTAMQADSGPLLRASQDMASPSLFRGAVFPQEGQALPALPAPATWALFLDLDGTLLDLQPTPEAVRPAQGLAEMLARLNDMTDGALAIVTGRSVDFADGLFPGHRFTIAGLHGAELRPAPGSDLPPQASAAGDEAAFRDAHALTRQAARSLPGVLFEDKGRAFALHYRQAPRQQPAVARAMDEAAARAGDGYRLRRGKCVVELCPAGQDKGTILRNLMASQPFLGRYPVAAGDDLTDEAMFRAVNALGGLSLRIGPRGQLAESAAVTGIRTPGAFRSWLKGLTA